MFTLGGGRCHIDRVARSIDRPTARLHSPLARSRCASRSPGREFVTRFADVSHRPTALVLIGSHRHGAVWGCYDWLAFAECGRTIAARSLAPKLSGHEVDTLLILTSRRGGLEGRNVAANEAPETLKLVGEVLGSEVWSETRDVKDAES